MDIREMTLADIEPVIQLTGRYGRALRNQLADRNYQDWVFDLEGVPGRVIGYARCVHFTWGIRPTPSPDAAPEGWYFMGAYVDSAYRRQGISQAFTDARLEWLRPKTDRVWYFTPPSNEAATHAAGKNGFQFVTDTFHYPGNELPSRLYCHTF